jgi:hypothetical protein
MNMFSIFRQGAAHLVTETMAYTDVHQMHGLSAEDWSLVTQSEPWNIEDRKRVKSVIAECVTISLTIAGLPAMALPGQYVAAVIACIVAPANILVAATRAPDAFDGVAASGLQGDFKIEKMTAEQMISLCLAYASAEFREPVGLMIPKNVSDVAVKDAATE